MTLKEQLQSVDLKLKALFAAQRVRALALVEPEPDQLEVMPAWRAEMSVEEKKEWSRQFWRVAKNTCRRETKTHAVPLTILGALLLIPKLIWVWVPFVLSWWVVEVLLRNLSPADQNRVKRAIPERWQNSRVFRELSEGMEQIRPFILGMLYLFCIPFALNWMFIHWALRLIKPELTRQSTEETITLLQNRRQSEEEEEENFYHSPAFSITCLLLYGSGLPAFVTYLLYQRLGIDAIMGFPSLDPHFRTVFLIIHLYIASLSWCAAVLFFKSWFTFPLNFAGNEEEIEMNKDGVKRHSRSWFTQVLTLNSPGSGPASLKWPEITALRLDQSRTSLYPLPKTIVPANSPIYGFLNRLAQLVDGINGNGQEECLYFATAESKLPTNERINCGGMLHVKLSDLTGDERARLYYAVRKWAPHVVIDEAMQERVMGTTALQAPRYTQMWFDLLADKMPVKSVGVLPPAAKLENGALTIKERLASGGQANVYLAQQADGTEVVLKEFILSTSDAVGALVDSAGEFETEATLLSELIHPRIVKMLQFFAEGRRLYIVLEKVDGVSLRKIVKSGAGPLSEKETVDLALQVCDVLSYLHGQQPPVVHRDIAPDNLLLSRSTGIKVIDFSLAAAKKSRRTTSTMGKHSYAPPEQFKDQPCPQSDIYALGATMYFLLTGEDPKPITAANLKLKRSDVSEKVNEIILRATALDLEGRYQGVDWLKLDLEAAASELSVSSDDPEP